MLATYTIGDELCWMTTAEPTGVLKGRDQARLGADGARPHRRPKGWRVPPRMFRSP